MLRPCRSIRMGSSPSTTGRLCYLSTGLSSIHLWSATGAKADNKPACDDAGRRSLRRACPERNRTGHTSRQDRKSSRGCATRFVERLRRTTPVTLGSPPTFCATVTNYVTATACTCQAAVGPPRVDENRRHNALRRWYAWDGGGMSSRQGCSTHRRFPGGHRQLCSCVLRRRFSFWM